jgi:hypothetical protein
MDKEILNLRKGYSFLIERVLYFVTQIPTFGTNLVNLSLEKLHYMTLHPTTLIFTHTTVVTSNFTVVPYRTFLKALRLS